MLDIDEQYPELAERVVQWQAAQRGAASTPPWRPSDFGQRERAIFDKLPDLREMLDQAKAARATSQVPVQSVAPMQLPFTSVRTWTVSISSAMTKHWPNGSPPHWKQSSASEPKRLPSRTLTTPSIEDMPKLQNGRVGTGDVQESGTRTGRRNLPELGHAARVGNAVRARSEARVAGGARAGRGPRAVGVMRERHVAGMR